MTANPDGGRPRANAAAPEEQGSNYDVPADTFSLRLVIARHHAGRLSIEQAANRCGLNPGNWAHWEDGRRPRDAFDVAHRVSEGLGIDRNWLMFGGALLPARGRPTRRLTERTTVDTTWNRLQAVRPGGTATRLGTSRPKGRTDPLRPISAPPNAIRANYVESARAGEAPHGR